MLDEIRSRNEARKRLEAAATPGPWKDRPSPVQQKSFRCIYFGPSRDEQYATSALEPGDARFIANARNHPASADIDTLLAEIERLKAFEELASPKGNP